MSTLDNIGDNLDKENENHNFLPQKIELEDLDLGVRDFFEKLDVHLMDQQGRMAKVPVIWTNKELFAQRKHYWQGLKNENGEEISRPFIAITKKQVKQGTAPNKRTIPNQKTFTFTRERTFDGTLMGYDIYKVRQPVWVDCDYEIRLVTSYQVDVNIFYQDILRDGFSDGQGYMIINGHQVRAVLGEPSEDNEIDNIDDERVFQVIAPVTVHGKLFDPSQYEKRTTTKKVVLKMCESGDGSNLGSTRTFGGQGNSRPFRTSCDPANIYDYQSTLLKSVAAGASYTVSASTVVNASGTTIATLGPGESYTISTATCQNVTVLGPTGNTLASVAAGGTYNVPAALVLWSTGGTANSLGPNGVYQLSPVNVLDYSGGTVFNDAEQGQTRNLTAAEVFDYSGGTLSNLAPSGQYTVPSGQTIVRNSVSTILISEVIGPGKVFDYTVSDVELTTNAPAQIVEIPSGTDYILPDMDWLNSLGQDVENYLPIYYSGSVVVPDISVVDAGTGLSASTPVLNGGIVNVNFSGTTTVENSNQSFSTGYTSYGTYVLPDIDIENSTGGTVGTWPSVSAYTISDISYINSTGGTLGFMPNAYPLGGTIIVPQFSIVNQDGQSGSTFVYNNEVFTNFSAGTTTSGIYYSKPAPAPNGTVYNSGDTQSNANNGVYDWTGVTNPATFAKVDYSATEADVRDSSFQGPAGDGSDGVSPTMLVDNNEFGNKYRFTDSIGSKSSSSMASEWAHVDFNTHSYSGGATANYIIDHLTGLGYYTDNIVDGTKYSMDVTVAADGQTWGEWLDYVNTGATDAGYSDWRIPSTEEAASGPLLAYHMNQDWADQLVEDFRRYTILSTSFNSTACVSLYDSTNASNFIGATTKAGSSAFAHRISYVFVVRTHY